MLGHVQQHAGQPLGLAIFIFRDHTAACDQIAPLALQVAHSELFVKVLHHAIAQAAQQGLQTHDVHLVNPAKQIGLPAFAAKHFERNEIAVLGAVFKPEIAEETPMVGKAFVHQIPLPESAAGSAQGLHEFDLALPEPVQNAGAAHEKAHAAAENDGADGIAPRNNAQFVPWKTGSGSEHGRPRRDEHRHQHHQHGAQHPEVQPRALPCQPQQTSETPERHGEAENHPPGIGRVEEDAEQRNQRGDAARQRPEQKTD